jgi:hypothetical protein
MSCNRFAAALIIGLTLSANAGAQEWSELLKGAPPGANAIGLVDVSFLREQAKSAPDTAELLETLKGVLSEHASQGAFVAEMRHGSMEPLWEAAVVTTTRIVSPEKLAKLVDGYVDEVEGRKVVWSPKNIFLGTIGDDRVVAYKPANRKALAKFLRERKASGPQPLSPYLQSVVQRGTTKSPVVLGLDLADVVSGAALKQQLKSLDTLVGEEAKIDDIAKMLLQLKGVTFIVKAEDKARGMIRIDFESTPQILSKLGKPMFIEILRRAGANLPELADWKAYVQENTLFMTGNLEKHSLSHVLSLFNTPYAIGAVQSSSGGEESESQSLLQRQAKASLRYFKSVTKIIENLRGTGAQTLGQRGLWCDREGRKIDNLPILDVDPELVQWGAQVASLLRGTGLNIRDVNMKAATMEDVSMVSAGGGGYGWGGYGWGGAYAGGGLPSAGYNAGAAARDTANIQLAAQKNLAAQGSYLQAMNQIDTITAGLRKKMTLKYQVEF